MIVTHNMQQAARVSETTAFFNIAGVGKPGKLIEHGPTAKIFSNPDERGDRGLHLRPLRLTPTSSERGMTARREQPEQQARRPGESVDEAKQQ